jgi:TolB-like protein/DNA-binding winged helix-turn-helix (wHTH) protein
MDEHARPTAYEFADFRVDVQKRLLLLKSDRRTLPLSARAFDALLFFLEHPGELLDKSTLMTAIWPKVVVEENNLNQHISALRRVLGERPEEHRFIVTVPGRGYRFVAPVSSIGGVGVAARSDSAPSPPVAPTPVPVAPAAPPLPDRGPLAGVGTESPRRRVLWGLGAVGVVLASGLLWYVMHPGRPASPAAGPVTSVAVVAVRKPRLAILPFENLSPDPANAFFADGLHEEIVSTLAERAPGVEVISRTTMMSYRTVPPKPLAVVARELGASHLIEGSVRREANRVRLTLQLIDARTDVHIWSANYDRTLADSLTLESQVAEEVAGQLSARLTRPMRTAAALMQDTEAFDLYLKAVLALRTFGDDEAEFHRIEDLLTRVIARQPSFALAYAQRARARTLMFISSRETSEAFVSTIRADLEIARRLAPGDPTVLAALGFLLMCEDDTEGALKAYEAAEAAGLAEPEWLIPKTILLLRRGRFDELNATIQRMLTLDPADLLVIYFAAYNLRRAQQPAESLQVLEYARVPFPPLYEHERAHVLLEFAGRTQEFRASLEHIERARKPQLGDLLLDFCALLRFEHRYEELRALIDRVPVASDVYYSGVEFGPVGQTPTALFRGWTNLLLGDRTGASKDGHAVLQFVERQSRTRWNGAFLDTLAASGHAFAGECDSARADGRRALAQVSRADNALVWSTTALHVAYVDAWCGGRQDAIALLQQLSSGRPGFGPAVIARDPLLTVPLGQEPTYRALADQLENVIRETKLESDQASLPIAERRSSQPSATPGR